jgi:putative aminopeptidase FrvX
MNKDIRFVIDKIKEYTSIPSLTHHEGKFLEYLKKDFPTTNHKLRETKEGLFYEYKEPTSYLVTVHVDRISVEPYKWHEGAETLVGQLDNTVSVAIARLLAEKDVPVHIQFTTCEEILQSNAQIIHSVENARLAGIPLVVLDLDIDVAVDYKEIADGAISLRDHDSITAYDKELVYYLRKICDKNKIDYITKDTDWLMCQIGTTIQECPAVRGCYVGVPIWNYHSHKEIVSYTCIANAIALFDCLKEDYVNVPKRKAKVTV